MTAAFIVDGLTEKKIVQHLCPGSVVRMTQMNGKHVSVAAIAKAVSSLLALLRGRYSPVFIIFDREQRAEDSEILEEQLRQQLMSMCTEEHNVIIASPDRMIENWILADRALLNRLFQVGSFTAQDGSNGKAMLRLILREKGFDYHETTVGVDTFCKITPAVAAQNSRSFARFRSAAADYCAWLRR